MKYITQGVILVFGIIVWLLTFSALIMALFSYEIIGKQPDNACVEVRMTLNKNEVHVMCGKLTKGIE